MATKRTKAERRAIDGIVLLDKPSGVTSNAALQQVIRIFGAGKAGHTGSLDPLATGMLPICFGHATKLSAYLLDAEKTYSARVRLGLRTDTGDAEGRPLAESQPSVTREALEALTHQFVGVIRQVPPMYSAIKRDGRKLYELAREGVEIERAPREVTIHELRLTAFEADHFAFEVRCSKGTYVRTLAEDWAAAAGEHAHLVALRRTGVSPFNHAAMASLDELAEAAAACGGPGDFLLPSISALVHWPKVAVTPADEFHLRAGSPIRCPSGVPAPTGPLCLVNAAGDLLWIAEHDGEGLLAPKRWFGRDPAVGSIDAGAVPDGGPELSQVSATAKIAR